MRARRRHPLTLAAAGTLALAAVPTTAVFAHGGDGDRRGHHGNGPASTTPALPQTLALPNGWQPEGIAAGKRGALYVGSIPTGAVQQLDPRTGQGRTLVPPREGRAAIGLKVADKTLVVAGGTTGRAFFYDEKTGADVADVPLTSGNAFVNDVAVTKCGAVFTDSRQQQLYRVTLKREREGWGVRGHGDHRAKHDARGTRSGGGGHGHGWGHGKHCSTTTTPQPTTPEPQPTASRATTKKLKQSRSGVTPTVTTVPITGALQYDADPATIDANGIVAVGKGHEVLVVQSRTGKLFRVNTVTGTSVEVPVTGGPLANGDGLLLIGRVLFVVQNRLNQIAVVKLARDLSGGEVKQTITSPLFRVPTTLAANHFGLYTVNARFGTPPSPATDYDVVRVPLGTK